MPLVLLGMLVTHLFGRSAGRGGGSAQMGGSVFGTPIAGAVFALDVLVNERNGTVAARELGWQGRGRSHWTPYDPEKAAVGRVSFHGSHKVWLEVAGGGD